MRLQTFLVPVTLLTSVLSFRPDVPSLDSRQVPCNESNDWSEWNQNCCVGGACPSSTTCTAGEEECASTMTTLHLTWSQIMTTTTTTQAGHTIYTQETSYASTGTGCLPLASNSQSSFLGTVTSASSGMQPTSLCSSGTCSSETITQGSIPPSLGLLPDVHTTDTSSSTPSTGDSTWDESTSMVMTNTPLATSAPANPDATSSKLAATGTSSIPNTTATTGSMSSPSASSSSTHRSPTTSTTPFTGSSAAERPLMGLAAVGVVLCSMVVHAILL